MIDHIDILTVTEAASLLNVHRQTILKMIADGRLPAARVGGERGEYRIRRTDLDALWKQEGGKS